MIEITMKNGRKMRTTEAVARVLRSRMLTAEPQVEQAAVKKEGAPVERISPTTGKPVRQYQRRDMKAED